jgi:hypothetical protein
VLVVPVRDTAGDLAKSEETTSDVWGIYQKELGAPTVHELENITFTDRVYHC